MFISDFFYIFAEKKKTIMRIFGKIKVGDVVHYCTIKNNEIVQDCAGNIVMDAYVSDISPLESQSVTAIKLEKMSCSYTNGFVRNNEGKLITECEYVYAPKERNLIVLRNGFKEAVGKYEISPGDIMIISTNKAELISKLVSMIDETREEIDKLSNVCKNAELMNTTMKMSVIARAHLMGPEEEEEKELTEEEFACIAL